MVASVKLHGKRFERKDRPRAENLFARVGSSLIAVSYHTYYGVPGIESRAFLPEGRVPGGRVGGSEEGITDFELGYLAKRK